MASECRVCCSKFRDPRLLACLHSACRSCIDHLAATLAGSKQDICCPVCGASCCLPDGGATALPLDITSLATHSGTCDICEGKNDCAGNPLCVLAICNTCHITLCEGHAVEYMKSAPEVLHAVEILAEKPAVPRQRLKSEHYSSCPEHAQPQMYYCAECDVFICGGCTAVGKHQGHKPIEYGSKVAKEKADAGVETLSSAVEPRLKQAVDSVEQVTRQFIMNADKLSDNIRLATQRALDSVEQYRGQLVEKLEGIKIAKQNALRKQRDDLTTRLDAVNYALQFHNRVQQHPDPEEQTGVLVTLSRRAGSLVTEVSTQACEDATVQLLPDPPSLGVLLDNVRDAFSTVLPGHTSSAHSSFEHLPESAQDLKNTITHRPQTPTGANSNDRALPVEDEDTNTRLSNHSLSVNQESPVQLVGGGSVEKTCIQTSNWEKCARCPKRGRLVLCDSCRLSYHPYCLNPRLKPVPKGNWYCPVCQVSPTLPPEVDPSTIELWKTEDTEQHLHNSIVTECYKLLKYLQKHENSEPFREPVEENKVPGYYNYIKKPMDLSTVEKRLRNGAYRKKENFVSDLFLIFDNCDRFNKPYTEVAGLGRSMRLFLCDQLQQIQWEGLSQPTPIEHEFLSESESSPETSPMTEDESMDDEVTTVEVDCTALNNASGSQNLSFQDPPAKRRPE